MNDSDLAIVKPKNRKQKAKSEKAPTQLSVDSELKMNPRERTGVQTPDLILMQQE